MKAYFALNHNPDAKDLKELAQKTGLTKRVLQVRLVYRVFVDLIRKLSLSGNFRDIAVPGEAMRRMRHSEVGWWIEKASAY